MLNSHPNCEHKPSDRQTIRTPQNGVQVPLIGGLVVHDVELHGVDLAIILVLGPLGVVGAPVEVELEHLVRRGQGPPAQPHRVSRGGHIKLLRKYILESITLCLDQ